MSFLAPLWLLLGAAAAVPLLLHLMRRNVGTRVDFPAARYLLRAEQEHSRSLRLRNLLLMLLRVLIVLAIALAAARPFVRGLGAGHGPTALAIVLDNSLSTTAVRDGSTTFERLRASALDLVTASTSADKLWLVTADGRVTGGSREVIASELHRVAPIEGAGNLPLAVRRAESAVAQSLVPARVVAVATDGQRSAWRTASRVSVPVALLVPRGNLPPNRAVLDVSVQPPRWTPRGTIVARVDSPDSVGYRVLLGERTIARGSASRAEPVTIVTAPPERGWQGGRVEIERDDYPADDWRAFAMWIGAPPAVRAGASAGTFAAVAVGALVADGRATSTGSGVQVASPDAATALPALLVAPSDPLRIGAANRALARLGIPWRYGAIDRATSTARGARVDGVAITERYALVPAGPAVTDTLATVAGTPWIVAGPGYVLVGSRLDPGATALPIRATFIPWLADMLALRLSAGGGELGTPIVASPGEPVHLPSGVDALESLSGARRAVAEDSAHAPAERGVWFLLRQGRRVGAIVVNAPPGESALAAFSAGELASRLGGSAGRSSGTTDAWVDAAFAAGSRRPALVPLLVLALLLLAGEAIAVRSSRSIAA